MRGSKTLKIMIAVLLVVAMLPVTYGCGGGEEPQTGDAGTGTEGTPTPSPTGSTGSGGGGNLDDMKGEWFTPADLTAFAQKLAYLSFELDSDEEGLTQFEIVNDGREKIGEDEANKMVINTVDPAGEESQIIVWSTDDGEVVKLDLGGTIYEGETASSWSGLIMMGAFLAFEIADGLEVANLTTAASGSGWSAVTGDVEIRTFGDTRAKVATYSVSYDATITGDESVTFTWEIGDFGDFRMVVGWLAEDFSDEGGSAALTVTRVTFR